MRGFVLALCLLVPAAPSWAATWVGASAVTASSSGTCSPTYTSTTGNSVGIKVWDTASIGRTYTVAKDGVDIGSAFANFAGSTTLRRPLFFRQHGATGSSMFVVTQAGGAATGYVCQVVEWLGAPIDGVNGDGVENTAIQNHFGAASGHAIPAGALVICMAVTATVPGGYDDLVTNTNATAYADTTGEGSQQYYGQYVITTGAESGEKCAFDQTGTKRADVAIMVSFEPSTPSGGGLLLRGVGE